MLSFFVAIIYFMFLIFGIDFTICGVDYNGTPGGESFCITEVRVERW